MKKNNFVRSLILWMGILLLVAPISFGEEIFPASIKVEGPVTLLKEIADDYPLDMATTEAVHLFVTQEEHADLLAEFKSAFDSGELTITFIQTASEANANFQVKTVRGGRGYHTYNTMLSELKNLANQNSSFVKLYDIGNAEGGQHDIWALKISDNVASEEDEPGVFLTGAHHGNERPTVEMVMHVANHIINSYNTNSKVTELVNNAQIFLIPMVNPYGHSQNRRTNANGVDLNRNYPTSWAPVSEGETKAMVNSFLAKHHLVIGMDYHTYGSYYMSPWAYTSKYAADHTTMKSLRDDMAGTVGYQSTTINEFLGGGGVQGSSCDYYYGKYAIYGYGVELGNSHSPPVSQMEQIVSKNLDAAMMLLTRPLDATVTGRTTNNNKAVQATVKVKGVDDGNILRNPVKSSAAYGRYYRMLNPGTYTFLFTYGGKTVTKNNVSVTSNGQTVVDVDFSGVNPDPNPEPDPPPNDKSCKGYCGKKAPGNCYCDNLCENYGDCCADKVQVCGF